MKTCSMLKFFSFTRKVIKKIKVTIDLLVFHPKFQKYMKEQLVEYCGDLLSKYQCGFRHDYGTQNCLLAMMEKLGKLGIRKLSSLQS